MLIRGIRGSGESTDEVIWKVEISDSSSGWDELKNIVFSTGGNTLVNLPSGIAPIPEPSSLLLLGSGVLGLAQVLRRKLM
jgi:hypothetical protein